MWAWSELKTLLQWSLPPSRGQTSPHGDAPPTARRRRRPLLTHPPTARPTSEDRPCSSTATAERFPKHKSARYRDGGESAGAHTGDDPIHRLAVEGLAGTTIATSSAAGRPF